MWRQLRQNLRPGPHLPQVGLVMAGLALVLSACATSASPPSTVASSPPSAALPSIGSATSPVPSGCPAPVDSGAPIAVLGTENFYADLLTQIGGSRVSATSLLNDPNADPHAFETSPQDAALVADAKLVIVNGLGYDAFMDKLLAASRTRRTRSSSTSNSSSACRTMSNVHIWYDPATMPKVAAAATAGAEHRSTPRTLPTSLPGAGLPGCAPADHRQDRRH